MRLPAPLKIRAFRRLLAAYCVNALGNWLGDIALAAVALHETGSPLAVAGVLAAGQFVPALAGPLVVARAERLPADRAIPLLLAFQALVFGALAVLVTTGFPLAAVLALAALDGIAGLAARALSKATVVAVTEPRDLLPEGNAILTGAFTVCTAVGPVVAGVVIATLSAPAALAIDAATFAGAALLLAFGAGLPTGAAAPAPAATASAATAPRSARGALRADRELRRLLGGYAVMAVLATTILPVEIVLVTETLGGDTTDFGTVLALWGAGSVVGGALLTFLRRAPVERLVLGSFAVYALSYLGAGTAGSIELVGMWSFVGGIANGVEAFAVLTAVQRRTPAALQVRVNGLLESLETAALGTGLLIGGAAATAVSPRAVYVAAAVGIALVVVLLLASRRPSTGQVEGAGSRLVVPVRP
jgi:hypothetical protein